MGLFSSEDGHYQGWLATLLCCCAALPHDEYLIEKQTISRPMTSSTTLCYEQPTPLQPMQLKPVARTFRYNKNRQTSFDEDYGDHVVPISERPPSLKPLDFGETSLLDRMSLHTRRKSSTTLMNRTSTGKPLDFRRLEQTEKHRRSLVPLQLRPVSLRKEPFLEPDHMAGRTALKSIEDLVDPIGAYPGSTVSSQLRVANVSKEHSPSRPVLSSQSSSSSLRTLRHQGMESWHSASSGSSRSSFERMRLKRKRSGLKMSGESADFDVDKEISELNTIIEERRVETTQAQGITQQHVPAIAPRMPVRARSETLTEIGSAFSRPLMSGTNSLETPDVDVQVTAQALSPVVPPTSRLSRPFSSMPDPGIEQSAPQHIRRPSSRVAGWLSNMFLSTSSTSTRKLAQDPARNGTRAVRDRAVSESSLCTTIAGMESPAATASSPVSKRSYSRSLTAESRATPATPLSIVDGNSEPDPKPRTRSFWLARPGYNAPPSQVGVAL